MLRIKHHCAVPRPAPDARPQELIASAKRYGSAATAPEDEQPAPVVSVEDEQNDASFVQPVNSAAKPGALPEMRAVSLQHQGLRFGTPPACEALATGFSSAMSATIGYCPNIKAL